jgi:hypothetical protein
LTRHVKVEQGEETDKVFRWRRIDSLKRELKLKFNYPIFTRIERAQWSPDVRRKSLPAKYRLDETPFHEAEEIAAAHLNMQPGADYIPGKAREAAALTIANKNRFGEKPAAEKREKPSEFQQLKNAEKRLVDALKKIYELLEDMGEPTFEFQIRALAYKTKVDEVLLKRKRKAKYNKSTQNGHKSTDFSTANDSEKRANSVFGVSSVKPDDFAHFDDVTKKEMNTLGYTPEADPLINSIIEDETEQEAF